MPSKTVTESPQTAAPVALRVSELTVSAATEYGRIPVIQDVSLTLRPGRVTGLAGESGSGKTVTALTIMRLLEPRVLRVEAGRIEQDGADILRLGRSALRSLRGGKVSMIFQEPMTSLDPMFTVGFSISEVIRTHLGVSRAEAKRRTIELLDRVGIPNPAERFEAYPFQMSGGMLQRVLIAMAISCGPKVLIADEPTTALDVTVQKQIMGLLRDLASEGLAVLLVTHDMGVMSEYADDLVVMYAGQVIESGPTSELVENPQHPYTAGLLASVPSTEVRSSRLHAIPGKVPMLQDMPEGCRFAPRCVYAEAGCQSPVALEPAGALREVRCVRHDELTLEGVR
ncbi:ATP-binding cassette domain-containing protein [Epidermidibacterium keratini]|uniref:ATP-binding cassette domain-containing protein n=1 Tax=Epidermidibacterium keratini TaxID=1891644 RepID=A0A7L4YLH7_9ACTN|nr:ABC transporter ATP-binding protein [Epidermidibacterium keratini]QHB99688.1 ATP-binding cassette domain-containing protein [Epidermidibacterium keratini]